jgi:hypothetical protein
MAMLEWNGLRQVGRQTILVDLAIGCDAVAFDRAPLGNSWSKTLSVGGENHGYSPTLVRSVASSV